MARVGFVVAQPEHRGDNWQDFSRAGPESWKTRPQDVSETIDAVARDPELAPLVDTRRVGVHGMSAGGVTGLSLAGGQWRLLNLIQHCNAQALADEAFCFQGAHTPEKRAERQARFDRAAPWPEFVLPAELKTLHGGRIEPFQRFFTEVEQHHLPIKMTFDIGNWHWQDQSAASAARGITRQPLSAEQICRRALLAMVNEAALLFAEGVAARASDSAWPDDASASSEESETPATDSETAEEAAPAPVAPPKPAKQVIAVRGDDRPGHQPHRPDQRRRLPPSGGAFAPCRRPARPAVAPPRPEPGAGRTDVSLGRRRPARVHRHPLPG